MSQQAVYRFDEFVVDPETWRLFRAGREIHLEPVVLKLLIYLIANRDRLVTREELMDTVWADTVISESALTKAVARLRKALDDHPAAPRYVETVRSLGYRFVAPVEEAAPAGESGLPARKARTAVSRGALYLGAAAMVMIVALTALAVLWPDTSRDDPAEPEVVRSLAVLPLQNLTGDPDQEYYVDGLQDLLTTELSQVHGLRVISRQSTKRYRDSRLSTADIAAELGVDALVQGSLLREGSDIEVTVQLTHGQTDEYLWAERYEFEASYVFDLVSDVANAIGAAIGPSEPSEETDESGHDRIIPVDPRAIDAYALGIMNLDRFTGDGLRSAVEQFEKAVAIEPQFALAWGQLAATHAMLGLHGFALPNESIEMCRIASLKAIEADPEVSIGHSGLGWARMWTGDFDDACPSFDEALRLNPSGPYAIHGDADCLLFDGRMDESLARLRELVTVSPFSAMHNRPLSSHLYMARRYDEAIAAARAMQVRAPQFSIHGFIARVYWAQGLHDEALDEERLELERRGDTQLIAALDEGQRAAGPTGAMRAMARALVARAEEAYVDPYRIGATFARAGLVEEALEWLSRAAEHGSYEMTYLAFWPDLDAVRADPRYEDLLERVYGARTGQIRRSSESVRPAER